MHRTLEDSIQALVGRLPAVAPVAEVKEKPQEPLAPGLMKEGIEAIRQGLQETIQKLQGVLDQLKEMSP